MTFFLVVTDRIKKFHLSTSDDLFLVIYYKVWNISHYFMKIQKFPKILGKSSTFFYTFPPICILPVTYAKINPKVGP